MFLLAVAHLAVEDLHAPLVICHEGRALADREGLARARRGRTEAEAALIEGRLLRSGDSSLQVADGLCFP